MAILGYLISKEGAGVGLRSCENTSEINGNGVSRVHLNNLGGKRLNRRCHVTGTLSTLLSLCVVIGGFPPLRDRDAELKCVFVITLNMSEQIVELLMIQDAICFCFVSYDMNVMYCILKGFSLYNLSNKFVFIVIVIQSSIFIAMTYMGCHCNVVS